MIDLPALVQPWIGLVARTGAGDRWVEHERRVDRPEPAAAATERADRQATTDGFGPLFERQYTIRIADATTSAADLLTDLAANINDFAPTGYAWFRDEDGAGDIVPGSRWTVELPGPWSGPVDATVVDDRRFRLETRLGHLEAGWIEFSVDEAGPDLRFSITSRARAGDPLFDLVYRSGPGRLLQTDMWVRVLEAGAARSGGRQLGRVRVLTVVHEGSPDADDT